MDLGGPQLSYQRFYESAGDVVGSRLDKDFEPYIKPSFEIAASLRQSEQFEVYNLSTQSRLPAEVIPKISLPEALQLIREDDKLMS